MSFLAWSASTRNTGRHGSSSSRGPLVMALYEYECSNCHRVTTELRPIARRERKGRCGWCKKGRLRRAVSVPGIIGGQSAQGGRAAQPAARVPMATFYGLKID